MTWFAWRSQRLLFIVGGTAVLLFIGWLYLTGSHESAAFADMVRNHCMSNRPPGQCNRIDAIYYNADEWSDSNIFILNALPGLLGLAFGVPLVAREIEHGTNRLAWSQSITRTRWLTYKLMLGTLFTAVVLLVLLPVTGWWSNAAHTGPHVVPKTYDVVGIAPLAYALFAFMLGAALGALIRRTGWAIAAGVGIFAAARLGVDHIRSHFAPLAYVNANPYGGLNSKTLTNSWLLNSGYVPLGRSTPLAGHTWYAFNNVFYKCTNNLLPKNGPGSEKQFDHAATFCAAAFKVHFVDQVQPLNHFWQMQTVESAIFVVGALILTTVTVLAVRRWRT